LKSPGSTSTNLDIAVDHSGTKPANGLEGGGTLSTAAPAEEKPDQYVYDPNNAVPTIGGPLCCQPLPTGVGPQDQRPAEARGDLLVFSSPAFTQNTEVTGPISLDLYVSSSAVDTDFTGKVVDVWPNGFAQNLTEGILRLRYRNFAGETGAWKSRGDLSHWRRSLGDEQCFPARTQTEARGFQQQLPAI